MLVFKYHVYQLSKYWSFQSQIVRLQIKASQQLVFYLIEFWVLHGCEFKSRQLALILQHAVQQLGSRPHIVAKEIRRVGGGAVKQPHGGLGALVVHPWSVASQLVILVGEKSRQVKARRNWVDVRKRNGNESSPKINTDFETFKPWIQVHTIGALLFWRSKISISISVWLCFLFCRGQSENICKLFAWHAPFSLDGWM